MDDNQIRQRLAREDAFWNGPRFHGLLFVSLAMAIFVIYVIASVRNGDFSWQGNGLAHDPSTEILPANW